MPTDGVLVAMLSGHAERCVTKRIPLDEAVAGLREITTRPDLLAGAAGVAAGAADPDSPVRAWKIAGARLLVQAGANTEQLPSWIAQGRQNMVQGSLGLGAPREWPDDLGDVLREVLDERP